ncbi:MAG: UbiA family prenyltransferase [Phycisphaerales bacterium]|nr:UbiA family prenyltransferase [Phycisphaerales bacterium]
MLRALRDLGEMIKFSHSVFALPFAALAAFLAARPGIPTLGQLALVLICMVAARSAAMTFNRVVDAAIDARNPRTAGRHIPRGAISRGSAWAFFVAASTMFLAGCAGFLVLEGNAWPLWLGAPVLLFLCFYSYTKRITRWSHVVLGAGIAFAPVAAWIAVSPQTLGPPAWLLMLAVATWIAGFDVIYACQDAEFDRSAGLHSLPSAIGVRNALLTARGLHVVTAAALAGVGLLSGLGLIYFVGVGCVVLLLIVENAIVSANDLSHVNVAFFTVNGVVGLVLGGLGIADVLLG